MSDFSHEPKWYVCAQAFPSLDDAMAHVGNDILKHGVVSNPRGMETKELLGRSFVVENTAKKIVSNPAREINIFFFYGELIWYMSGSNDVRHINHYNKRMSQFSDDGTTLRSAYGKRLLGLDDEIDGFNQFEYVTRMLLGDKESRKAIMHIRTVKDSEFDESKDMPCTIALQYFIRHERLIALTTMRSNDLIFGATYDIPFFMYMQERIAWELGVDVGEYYHQAMSLHVYSMHYEMVEKMYKIVATPGIIHHSSEAPKICCWGRSTLDQVFMMESQIRENNLGLNELSSMAKAIDAEVKDHGWRHALFCCLLNKIGRSCNDFSWMSENIIGKNSMYMAEVADTVAYMFDRMEESISDLAALQLAKMVEGSPLSQLVAKARARQVRQI